MTTLVDRISNLPDDILSHILSFLPTNFAVSTSVLSKRWEFVWKYVSNLHFDDELLNTKKLHPCISKVLKELQVKRVRAISVTSNNESLFRCNDDLKVEEWMHDAIKLKVEKLELCSSSINSLTLPRVLFTDATTLVELKLSGNIGVPNLPPSVCFPNLKKLDLVSLEGWNNEWVRKLITGCLALEELYIRISSRWSRWAVCSISSSSLTRLTIIIPPGDRIRYHEFGHYVDNGDNNEGMKLKLNVPNLRYIRIRDDDSECKELSVVGRLSSLIKIEIKEERNDTKEGASRSTIRFKEMKCC